MIFVVSRPTGSPMSMRAGGKCHYSSSLVQGTAGKNLDGHRVLATLDDLPWQ